ncbi:MAG TPA: ABC transporter substrate-binding protein [Rhizomicrobium sp.]|jgi:phospholipid transport system substrate-binding protein
MTPGSLSRGPLFAWRAFAALALVLVACLAVARPALAETAPETYVRVNVQHGLSILGNRSISDSDRRLQFRNFLTNLTDIRRIALFTLGAARRTSPPDEVERFVEAFREYAIAVYESRLTAYAGQSLRVTGGNERAPGDFIVTTVLVDPTGRTEQQGEPIEVDFRLAQENGHFIVIDASIAGVWLALEERDQFTAYLQENNGNLGGLIAHLNQLTQRLRGGGAKTPTR